MACETRGAPASTRRPVSTGLPMSAATSMSPPTKKSTSSPLAATTDGRSARARSGSPSRALCVPPAFPGRCTTTATPSGRVAASTGPSPAAWSTAGRRSPRSSKAFTTTATTPSATSNGSSRTQAQPGSRPAEFYDRTWSARSGSKRPLTAASGTSRTAARSIACVTSVPAISRRRSTPLPQRRRRARRHLLSHSRSLQWTPTATPSPTRGTSVTPPRAPAPRLLTPTTTPVCTRRSSPPRRPVSQLFRPRFR